MELTPEQQEELDEFREENPGLEMSDEDYLEFVEQNPNRELTLQQMVAVFESDISPAELLFDVERIAQLVTNINDLTAYVTLDNLAETISQYTNVAAELEKLGSKYEYTEADDVLKEIMNDRYGIDLENLEFEDIEDKIEALEDEALEEKGEAYVDEYADALEDNVAKADAQNSEIAQAMARELENIQGLISAECDPERPATCTVEGLAVAELKEQYEKIEEMRLRDDVPRDDMITAYKTFINDHDTLMMRLEGGFSNFNEDAVGVKDAILAAQNSANIQIGVPPQLFADGGAHYASLLAEEVAQLAGQADVMRLDGDAENYEEFLSDKLRLYQNAKRELDYANTKVELYLKLDPEFVERESGYSAEYLDNQIEVLKMEQEALSQPFAEEVELETDAFDDDYTDPELGSVDDPAETPVIANIPVSSGATFKV